MCLFIVQKKKKRKEKENQHKIRKIKEKKNCHKLHSASISTTSGPIFLNQVAIELALESAHQSVYNNI